jgi:2-C-methyl-D-erythritol 4-phosphate cytidylyltransferase
MDPQDGSPGSTVSHGPMSEDFELWGVVVAAGSGVRFGRRKQLLEVGGRRVLDWALDAVRPFVTGLVVVVPADLLGADGGIPSGSPLSQPPVEADIVVVGGKTRSASVRAGLDRLPPTATHVLVHDAARPLADRALVGRVVGALTVGIEAAVPVVALADTLRLACGGSVDRDRFVAVQTPQGFDLAALRAAHATGTEATDDATLIDAGGGTVVHVEGDPLNFKITVSHELLAADVILNGRR